MVYKFPTELRRKGYTLSDIKVLTKRFQQWDLSEIKVSRVEYWRLHIKSMTIFHRRTLNPDFKKVWGLS